MTLIHTQPLTQLTVYPYARPDAIARLRVVCEGLRYNLVVDSILDGNTPGWIFVDDADAPHSVLLWNRQDALLIAGAADNAAFNAAVSDVIARRVIPDAKRRYIPELTLFYDRKDWQSMHKMILQGLSPVLAARRYYKSHHLNIDWRTQLPAGCEIRCIDATFLTEQEYPNIEHVEGWINSFWRSHQEFTEKSLGYALLTKDTDHRLIVASWCLAVYVSGASFELGLATHPDFRRQGFATLVAAAGVDHCLAHGYAPHWHCWEDNAASIATAEKVGFGEPVGYRVYRFEI